MNSQTQEQIKDDTIPQAFNNTIAALKAAIQKLYKEHPLLILSFLFFLLICIYILLKSINNNFIYAVMVTFLFVCLSICLYVKEKNSLNSIFSFSLGIFTAFAVSWNGLTFSIFFIFFIILVIGIFFIASIRGAGNVEEKQTLAAISYISDFETNKKDLQEVKANVTHQIGLLSIDTIWEAILFFAYQKVPKKQMIILIEALKYLQAVTKIDIDILLILLGNINHLSHSEASLETNIALLKVYILKGKSTPSKLVDLLNEVIPIAIENNIDFSLFTNTILTYLSSGYPSVRIVEKLSANFANEVS